MCEQIMGSLPRISQVTLQSIIYFLPGLTKSLGLVHFQAGKETIKTRLTNGERSRQVIF